MVEEQIVIKNVLLYSMIFLAFYMLERFFKAAKLLSSEPLINILGYLVSAWVVFLVGYTIYLNSGLNPDVISMSVIGVLLLLIVHRYSNLSNMDVINTFVFLTIGNIVMRLIIELYHYYDIL